MPIINKLSSSLGQRDDKPNKNLAAEILKRNDAALVKELAEALDESDKSQKASILEVLEWVATEKPELVAPYVQIILKQLDTTENRIKWGSMIVLARIASITAQEIWEKKEMIIAETENGSVITMDNGVKILAQVSSKDGEYEKRLFPFLLDILDYCRDKSVPQYAESVTVAVNRLNRNEFVKVLEKRLKLLEGSQSARVKKVLERVKEQN